MKNKKGQHACQPQLKTKSNTQTQHTINRHEMRNLYGLNAIQVGRIREQQKAAVTRYGKDPCTKKQAAAHESGHIVVGYTLGEKIDSARIMRSRNYDGASWIGENNRVSCAPKRIVVAQDHVNGFRCVLNNIAGYVGEIVAGEFHPSSSIDERYKAEGASAVLDVVWNKPQGDTFLDAMLICDWLIRNNIRAFNETRRHLEKRKRLTQREAMQYLSLVGRVDLDEMVKALSMGREWSA